MRYIMLIMFIILNTHTENVHYNKTGCLNLDLILLGDVSASMVGKEQFIIDAFGSFVDKLDISENEIHVSLVLFSSTGKVVCKLTGDKVRLKEYIYTIESDQGGTMMTDGLYAAANELSTNGRKGYNKIIIVVSDGMVNDVSASLNLATQLKASGIHLCAIVINAPNSDRDFMRSLSSEFCYVESDYQSLAQQLKNLNLCM